MSPLISVKNLKIEFRTRDLFVEAVKGISFDIQPGETLGLVGESGSGKSVTALSLLNLIPNPPGRISSGQILFDNQDITRLTEKQMCKIRGNRISMIFQEPMTSLNPVFTIGYQISEALLLHRGLSKKEAHEHAIDLLDQVGIKNPRTRIDSYPHEMSGGQRQRVMIAMAVACKPDLLIADEPTTALDVTVQKQIVRLLKDLQDKYKMSLLFISHDLGIIAEVARKVMVMYRGKIVESANAKDIFIKPQHAYSKGLIACRPSLDIKTDRLPVITDFLDGKEIKAKDLKSPFQKKVYDQNLLEVKNLIKHFPLKRNFFGKVESWVKAVDDVSFSVQKGSTLGLVGGSGCGKTTLGRSLLRLTEPSSGSIFYDNIDITGLDKQTLKSMRRRMQIIFQDPYASLNPRMNIGQSIMEPIVIHKLYRTKEERFYKAEQLIEQVGLKKDMLHRYPHEFSGGQRQRICIARAIAIKPEFIICDESVSSLDVSIQAQILNLLKDLQDQLNLTYIFISHDLTVVKFISDQVAVMNQGKIVEINSSEKIYNDPQSEYTKTLIEAVPAFHPQFLV